MPPLRPDLLEILCDPVTQQPLRLLTPEQLAAVNDAIARGGVVDASGNAVTEKLEEGLVTEDGKTIFRVDEGIPIMLAEQAIPAESIDGL